jgi:hypothetical protein
MLLDVVVIQRVRIRWSAANRGAAAANIRRKVPDVLPLPALPAAPIVLHDVLAWDKFDYEPSSAVTADPAAIREAGLWVEVSGDEVTVDRMSGLFPAWHGPDRLFALRPGQVARFRANRRMPWGYGLGDWHYEQWTVHVAHTAPSTEVFLQARLSHDVDWRGNLYG